MLVLIMVLGAVPGLLVLWFTVLRHERTVRRRAYLRPKPDGMALAGIGTAAVARAEVADVASAPDKDSADEDAGDEASRPSGAAWPRKRPESARRHI
jgi:hypothetical protein